MGKDRYERRHRRTASHPESMAIMAAADFNAVPSLTEALKENDVDAIKSFFRKHHAVPANDHGPQYPLASDEAIIGHAERLCKAWDADESSRPEMLPDMKDLRRETFKRAIASQPPVWRRDKQRSRLVAAWYGICERIGFGGDELG